MKNIILITVDGLRYDHSKIVKIKMDEILGQGIDFENAYSTGPSTSMSYIGLLCSKFPTFPDEINSITKLGVDRKRTLLYEILKNNGTGLDSVEKGVRITESDPNVRTVGYGGYTDDTGEITLDASIMDHIGNAGSVAYLENIKHPISLKIDFKLDRLGSDPDLL